MDDILVSEINRTAEYARRNRKSRVLVVLGTPHRDSYAEMVAILASMAPNVTLEMIDEMRGSVEHVAITGTFYDEIDVIKADPLDPKTTAEMVQDKKKALEVFLKKHRR